MTLLPGFIDPVHDSQACFRAVLDAMARPGTLHRVATPAEPPAALHRATAAILLTLVDSETTLHLCQPDSALAEWIGFHTGAPHAPVGQAAFVLTSAPPTLAGLQLGSDEAPEEGATLIVQLPALGRGTQYRIAGPGLPGPATFRAEGLPPGFPAEWAANRATFPRGIDLILCSGDQLAALPRTLGLEAL